MVSALCVEKLFLKKFLRWLLYHTEETQNMVCQVFLKPLNKLFSAHQQQMLCPMWRHAKKKKFVIKEWKEVNPILQIMSSQMKKLTAIKIKII